MANNGQHTSLEGQESSIPRDIGSLQPTVEFHGQNQIAFALLEINTTNGWSVEMANNGQNTSMENQESSTPWDISGSSEEPRPLIEFNEENQIVFAFPEIHQQTNLAVEEFQNGAAVLNPQKSQT